MNKINLLVLMSATMLGSGCASIVSGQNQSVSLETRSTQGETVLSANCKLSNNKGTWFVTSPGSVTVRRSYEDLLIDCEKENQDHGLASVKSSTKAMAFGNILFGGVIGAGVDMASGAAYDYPTMITVLMGKKITVGTPPSDPSEKPPTVTAGAVSGTSADAASTAGVHP